MVVGETRKIYVFNRVTRFDSSYARSPYWNDMGMSRRMLKKEKRRCSP